MVPLQKRVVSKSDGRQLLLYGHQKHYLAQQLEPETTQTPPQSHLRWHPFRQEWVCYAAHRQNRTFKPPKNFCPLCPTSTTDLVTEIPFTDFEVAVFDNRFSAFSLQPNVDYSPNLFPSLFTSEFKSEFKSKVTSEVTSELIPTAPATGHCEVMVYSPDHGASLGTLPQSQREVIVQVWADRYRSLLAEEALQFVMPFENRGEEVGVTLHHPHGQIYGFGTVPPVVEKMALGFRNAPGFQALRAKMDGQYDVFTEGAIAAFVPPFQRYPYEVWLTTETFHPGLWTFADDEMQALATALGKMVRLYDRLFARPMPYLMLLYGAPKGEEKTFQFHVQFLPFLRAADKLKYLAGCETGAGLFLADMLPEETAAVLREQVEWETRGQGEWVMGREGD